ncbi:hypothetical protein AB1Y20_000946 [Prymnesium parvum]|uniref:Uncharacterized protein n=1 Tax=Prymnesium parvum TaxID=97485 RepID=A0AB34KAL0_PRYPA
MAPSASPDPSPHSTAARKTSFFVPFSSMPAPRASISHGSPLPRASTSHGSPLPRASHSSSRGSLGHAAPHQSPRERMLITSFGDPKSIAATRNSVRSSAFSKGGRKSVLASMLSSDTQSPKQEHGKSKRNALNSGNSALVQDAARRRNEMQKRLEFFELLSETASQVEGAMTLIQLQQQQQEQKTREEADAQGIDEMDSPTELALNKVRVSKLMGTLHLDKVVTKLKDVLDWLESASDPSGVHERRYVQAESESEEAAIAARIAANQVFADMHERESLTEEKLQSFANELSDVIRRKVQRDLAKLKRANKLRLTSSMDPKGMELGLDSDVVQLEITVGLLRTQLLRREEQQRLAGNNQKNLRSSLIALKEHTPDIADKLKQMTTITRDQAAHIMEQEWRNQQWREEVSLLKESILELNFEMSRSTQRLAVLNEDVFSYRVERSTYEDELTERSLQHTESLKKAIKPSAELEALFGAHDTLAFQAAELRFEVEQAAANASTKKKGLHDRLFPLLKERQEVVAVLSAFAATRAGLENIPETISKSRGCSAVRPSSAGSEGRSSVRSSSSILTSLLLAADPGSEAAETALSQLREMKAPLASRAAEAHQAQNAFEADSIMREKREHLVANINHVEEVLKAEGAKLERLKLQREDEPQMDHADVTSPEVELMKYLHSDGKEILQMVRSQLDKSARSLERKISRKTVSSGEAQLSWAASATQSWVEQLDQAIKALASEIEKSWKLTEGGLGLDIRELGDEVARVLEIYKHVQNRSNGATNYDVTNNRTPNHGSRTTERTTRPLPSLANEIDANDGLEHGHESAQSPTSAEHRRSCLSSSRRHQEGPGKTGHGKKLSWLGDQDHDYSENDSSPCCARTHESYSGRLAGEMHSDGVEGEAGTQYMRQGKTVWLVVFTIATLPQTATEL